MLSPVSTAVIGSSNNNGIIGSSIKEKQDEELLSSVFFYYDDDTKTVPYDVTHVIISDMVKVPKNALANRYSLRTVLCLEGVEIIGKEAFDSCHQLRTLKLPSTLRIIDCYAFYECRKLMSSSSTNGDGGILSLPCNLTTIGRHAFLGCKSITTMRIPSSTQHIHEKAFQFCNNLRSVHFYFSNENWKIQLKDLGAEAFHYCPNLETVYNLTTATTTSAITTKMIQNAFSNKNLQFLSSKEVKV
mmetsp:Transcript_4455/g.5164  ORF Transcript_4455/g.5164 Transcript_4455/m.5164 type:complete len:244 (-) Transcript_4455:211-942(-)|eukprot:CAMPEP_0194132774 /NCGR_PEP_ID=MMETSP0152-20130528/3169_1 /TAXON_ID=1049557 /ORGANISM="Thalassiothrix antarctica, Strain L6-D1" /LENGTH=243 /DNA_ID=CAMNT_0038827939 /DNA_START=116 /DNA_END=847 /DNA_ORIENTATION=+